MITAMALCMVTAMLSLSLMVCFTTPAAVTQYPVGTEMYPAVYGTFQELYPNAWYLNIDFYNNKYTLTGITGWALTTPITYDMTVELVPTGEIKVSYSDIYSYDAKFRHWNPIKSFGLYSFSSAAGKVSAKMMEIAGNPEMFTKYEKAAMADIKFVHRIMSNFSELAFADFVEKYAKGSVFNVSGSISNVQENKYKRGATADYKYVVFLTQKVPTANETWYSPAYKDTIYCWFYTNRDDVIRLNKTAVLSLKGTLVGARQSSGTDLSLDLTEAGS
jgi:hypothetical protein